ncbi:hypothetical protein MLD38_006277 [Melastoma candidum]|uniref:Uncharacterized protein n=1 Tax=Melastoma candidum TaxID=119954 RepID=A0ACB9RNM6_9MYRT|nr:hypothetical protein MLD38_006277 [Melastoma candidum]
MVLRARSTHDEQARLITSLKPVRKGTNGGVTIQGLLAAAAGGAVVRAWPDFAAVSLSLSWELHYSSAVTVLFGTRL